MALTIRICKDKELFKKAGIVIGSCLLGFAIGSAVIHFMPPPSQQLSSDIVGIGLSDFEKQALESRGLSEAELKEVLKRHAYKRNTVSGHYLAGRFAQRHHDWKEAGKHITEVLNKTGYNDQALLKRAMVLAMGAGEFDRAFELAHELRAQSEAELNTNYGALTSLFIAIEQFKKRDYAQASKSIHEMPEGSLSNFILPLLESWADAAIGKHSTTGLSQSAIHIYHAIMIADFMGQHDHIEDLLRQAVRVQNLNPSDIERIADIYAHIGNVSQARSLYEQALEAIGEDPKLVEKLEMLDNGKPQKIFERVQSAEAGVAHALYDMAQILAQEYSDESARVFGNMAIYLNPDLTDAKFLLARLAARNEQTEEAIQYYRSIAQEEDLQSYLEARRAVADLLEDEERVEEALSELQRLYDTHEDIESLIQIGDIHRRTEDFKKAAKNYNKAAKLLGPEIPADYWHLHYVRGMAYEQMDQWEKAEKDLQKALSYQPDHPYILNYLGYAWADQGIKLEEALELIKKAVEIRPADGYITDSLGWVLYRMQRFEEAIPYLELAVELMPYDPVVNDHLGDAYWRVQRKREARFQWTRAKNHAEEEELKMEIDSKLVNGLDPVSAVNPDIRAAQADDTPAEEL